MKQLLILSGKGGTGKTTIASSFIRLSDAKAYADCDVDAPNLHLVSDSFEGKTKKPYIGGKKSVIDYELCDTCRICKEHCKFNAIDYNSDVDRYEINIFACEGCGVCEFICPHGAIEMKSYKDGDITIYEDEGRIFSTAQLKMGSGTSGLLVSDVKKEMEDRVGEEVDLAIIDGSPGIGCPVIASISGVDMVLVVTEPSLSGISDMERIIKTCRGFDVEILVCVNKYDVNKDKTNDIKKICRDQNINYVGEIPYDKEISNIINEGRNIMDVKTEASESIKNIFKKTMELL